MALVQRQEIKWLDSELEARKAESAAIATEGPQYNVMQTEAYKAQQSATAKTITPEGRRARGAGVAASAARRRARREAKAPDAASSRQETGA